MHTFDSICAVFFTLNPILHAKKTEKPVFICHLNDHFKRDHHKIKNTQCVRRLKKLLALRMLEIWY
jgi:hypothetical protein